MSDVPHWLVNIQITLRSVAAICAVIGISVAWYDWQNWHEAKSAWSRINYLSSIPAFLLVCFMTLIATPAALSQLVPEFYMPDIWREGLRTIAQAVLLMYFYAAMVLRLRAYQLPRAAVWRRATATLLAMILLIVVGFYAA